MSNIGNLLLAIFLILVGATWLTWITVDSKVLGLLAFIVGVIILVMGVYPYVNRDK